MNKPFPTKPKKLGSRAQFKLDLYQYFCQIAEYHGGTVVSDHYEKMHDKMTFRCAEQHEFKAQCHCVDTKQSWCPYCAGNAKLTVADLQESARARGGELLTPGYLGSSFDHRWRCANNHEFYETPNGVRNQDCWCPICKKDEHKSIRQAQKLREVERIAQQFGCTINSTEYHYSRAPLSITCAYGKTLVSNSEKLRKALVSGASRPCQINAAVSCDQCSVK